MSTSTSLASSSSSSSLLTSFRSVFFILLLHLACFIFSSSSSSHPSKKQSRRPPSHSSPSPPRFKPLSSSVSFLKRIFSITKHAQHPPPRSTRTSPRNSQRSSTITNAPLELDTPHELISSTPLSHSQQLQREKPALFRESLNPGDDISYENQFFPLRNDIFPCTACGEIFPKPLLLEQHQAVKHAVTELVGDDSGKNIVHIIFTTGWASTTRSPKIHRVLKIHNSPKVVAKFEEYRESVKAKAEACSARRRHERCVADGNELLRFHCSTFTCDLGLDGDSCICSKEFCNVCGIIRSGFSPKLDGISTLSTGWRAHASIPDDVLEEFGFMNVKRAMLVCRVIAGRVGCEGDCCYDVDKEDGGFDSIVGGGESGALGRLDEEDLLVFNPRAVLPCFVIVYTV